MKKRRPELKEGAELLKVIRHLYGCNASLAKTSHVKEGFRGRVVWEGEVSTFSLIGHPTAEICYAWSHNTDAGKQRHIAVLHEPPIDSPRAAVRAAIVAESRKKA